MTNPPFNGMELPGVKEASPAEEINLPGDGKPAEGVEEDHECETCENRTYVDGSNENDVSFKSPGHIAPEAAASRSAFPNAGSVASLGCRYRTSSI